MTGTGTVCQPIGDNDAVLVSLSSQRWAAGLVLAALVIAILYACSFIERDPGPPPGRAA